MNFWEIPGVLNWIWKWTSEFGYEPKLEGRPSSGIGRTAWWLVRPTRRWARFTAGRRAGLGRNRAGRLWQAGWAHARHSRWRRAAAAPCWWWQGAGYGGGGLRAPCALSRQFETQLEIWKLPYWLDEDQSRRHEGDSKSPWLEWASSSVLFSKSWYPVSVQPHSFSLYITSSLPSLSSRAQSNTFFSASLVISHIQPSTYTSSSCTAFSMPDGLMHPSACYSLVHGKKCSTLNKKCSCCMRKLF
jgi:hypothetical protein